MIYNYCKVKNNTTEEKTYCDIILAASEEHVIADEKRSAWANDDEVLTAIANGELLVGNETEYFTTVNEQLEWLKVGDPKDVKIAEPFNEPNNFYVRYQGFKGTAAAGTTTDIDYKVENDRYFNGLTLILKGHAWGDRLDLMVVDKDNILGYGAGTVVNQFGFDWYVDAARNSQPCKCPTYVAKILGGLYVRVKYYSTGTDNIDVYANLLLHEKKDS